MTDFDAVLLTLVTRLRVGMLPSVALESLNEPGSNEINRLVDGLSAQDFLRRYPDWTNVLIALRLNRITGARLIPLLESQVGLWKKLRSRQQQLRTLSMASKATLFIICGLPVIILLASEASGIGVMNMMAKPGLALVFMVCGGGFLLFAGLWMRQILQKARRTTPDSGLYLELCAAALGVGLSLERAQAVITDIGEFLGVALGEGEELTSWQQLGRASGMPLIPLLAAAAEQAREQQHNAYERTLALVPIRLLLPIGLLGLPGFLLVGVLPTAFAMLVSTGFVGQ